MPFLHITHVESDIDTHPHTHTPYIFFDHFFFQHIYLKHLKKNTVETSTGSFPWNIQPTNGIRIPNPGLGGFWNLHSTGVW